MPSNGAPWSKQGLRRRKEVTVTAQLGATASGSMVGMVALAVMQLAQELDLDGVPTCPLCLLDLAFEIKKGRTPAQALVNRTTDWVWLESGEAVKAVVVQARMREVPFAEEALRDIELNGWRGRFAETVVWRLACKLAEELDR